MRQFGGHLKAFWRRPVRSGRDVYAPVVIIRESG
jgi:hypothetical protein